MVRTKVFVGNLSFKTQEADLAKEFEVAGKVVTANIISRGSRSLGYGFVEFDSEEEARKSVELLNKKQIDNREINVEVARPRDETAAPAQRAPRPQRPRGPRQQGNNNANAPAGANAGAAPAGEGQQQQAGDGARRLRNRKPRTRRPRDETQAQNAGEGAAKEGVSAPRPRRERAPRQKPEGERVQRTAAPNTLFVANLPFSVDDDGLSEIFAGLNLKSAHVVRKRNNRSKGFGFVEFQSADDQQKALQAVDKKKVQERELIVKVALTEVQAAAANAAATNGTPAAAPAATNNAAAAAAPAAVSSPKPN